MSQIANASDGAAVAAAVDALRRGQAVILPTDTVFGLAVAPRYASDPGILYRLKGRPSSKPVAWLVAGPADLDIYGAVVPSYARTLAQRYWPGPLTVIVSAAATVPAAFASAAGTIGLRMPDDSLALQLMAQTGSALATTSANLSGDPAPMRAADIDPTLCARVPVVLDDAQRKSGVPSTVVDCTGQAPRIVRQGAIDAAQVAACCS